MKITYTCEGCGKQSDDIEEIITCESQEIIEAVCEIGDIVQAGGGFGWYSGDARWIINPEAVANPVKHKDGRNCFDTCCTYAFFYIVTHIDQEKHRIRYHLATRAMNSKNGYRIGYTYNEGHIRPVKVKNPKSFLARSGRSLIGQKAKCLI